MALKFEQVWSHTISVRPLIVTRKFSRCSSTAAIQIFFKKLVPDKGGVPISRVIRIDYCIIGGPDWEVPVGFRKREEMVGTREGELGKVTKKGGGGRRKWNRGGIGKGEGEEEEKGESGKGEGKGRAGRGKMLGKIFNELTAQAHTLIWLFFLSLKYFRLLSC